MRRSRIRVLPALLAALALVVAAQPAGAFLPSLGEPADFSLEGTPCRLIEVPAADPVGTGPCDGVRPGALVQTPSGSCTLNFLFRGSDGGRYIGTAGHCILDEEGETLEEEDETVERSWAAGSGPVARDASGDRIGEFAYAVLGDPKDFALIRIDDGVSADPQMCHFGGPTGMNRTTPTAPVVLNHYGRGVIVGDVVPGRTALAATGMPSRDTVQALGAVVPGDSGSGIVSDDGRAVGVVVTVGVSFGIVGGQPVVGDVGVTRIGPQKDRAEVVLGIGLSLRTAPSL